MLELMIVIVLIGVLVGMVSFATGMSPAQQARQEATALAGVIRQLRERAVLEGQEYGVRLSVDGYRTMRLQAVDWQPLSALHRWPPGWHVRLRSEGLAVRVGADQGAPHLLMLSSDETSPFQLTFAQGDKNWLNLSSDGLGEARIDE